MSLGVLGAGLLVIVGARLLLPKAPPLYDGIIPIEPYLWLDPPPGERGGAKGTTVDIAVRSGTHPLVAVATPELEPQAQIFAPPGGLTIPSGAHSIKVSIDPVPSEGVPTVGHIDGNVYRIDLVDDQGVALTAPASARVTVVLRGTNPAQAEATVARFSGGSWVPLKTELSGFGGSFLAVVTEFGDFAVIVPGPGPSLAATALPSPTVDTSAVASGMATASPRQSAGSAPGSSPGDASGLTAWLLPAIVVAAIALALMTAIVMRRRRHPRHRRAHWDHRR